MSLENLILSAAEKRLRSCRLEAVQLKSDPAYERYVSRIQSAFDATTYWHGTGRYHYQQEVSTSDLLDILTSIVDDDGLKPHLDPWMDSGGETVSLGTVRMHSRLFARVHLNEHASLVYELGSVRYWIRLYAVLLLYWLLTNFRSCLQIVKSLFRRSSGKDLQARIGVLRKLHGLRIRDLVNGTALSSDISGNYPILIAVAKDGLNVIDTLPLTYAVEVRSLSPVRLKDIVYIEVPLANVAETEQLLASKSIDIQVLPMEFVDMYMSDIPLKQLAYC